MDTHTNARPNKESIIELNTCMDIASEHMMFLKKEIDGVQDEQVKLVMTDTYLALNELCRITRVLIDRMRERGEA